MVSHAGSKQNASQQHIYALIMILLILLIIVITHLKRVWATFVPSPGSFDVFSLKLKLFFY